MVWRTTRTQRTAHVHPELVWPAVAKAFGWNREKSTFGMCGLHGLMGFHLVDRSSELRAGLLLGATWGSGRNATAELASWNPQEMVWELHLLDDSGHATRIYRVVVYSDEAGASSTIAAEVRLLIGLRNMFALFLPAKWLANNLADEILRRVPVPQPSQ